LCNLVLFGLTLLAVSQKPRLRGEERFPVGRSALLDVDGQARNCTLIDLSLSGVFLGGAGDLKIGDSVWLSFDGIGPLAGTVVRKNGPRAGIYFGDMPEAQRDRLVVYLYTSGFTNQTRQMNPFRVLWQLVRGAVLGPT
jgi:cellulose synthase (UDP-forming)